MVCSSKIYEFLRFTIVGLITVITNLSIFQIVLHVSENIYYATLLGNASSIAINFAGLSKIFKSKNELLTVVKYLTSWISYYLLTIVLILLFLNLNLIPLAARIITLLVLTPVNYLVQKNLVFRRRTIRSIKF